MNKRKKNVSEILSQKTIQVWRYMPAILAMGQVKVGGSRSKDNPRHKEQDPT
jgi:hypothetical protein